MWMNQEQLDQDAYARAAWAKLNLPQERRMIGAGDAKLFTERAVKLGFTVDHHCEQSWENSRIVFKFQDRYEEYSVSDRYLDVEYLNPEYRDVKNEQGEIVQVVRIDKSKSKSNKPTVKKMKNINENPVVQEVARNLIKAQASLDVKTNHYNDLAAEIRNLEVKRDAEHKEFELAIREVRDNVDVVHDALGELKDDVSEGIESLKIARKGSKDDIHIIIGNTLVGAVEDNLGDVSVNVITPVKVKGGK